MAPRILLIINMPHWSVHKNAKDLVKYNRADLELDILYFGEFIADWEKYYDEYDLLYPMTNRLFYEFLIRELPVDKTITGILSFVSWDNEKTVPPGFNAKVPKSHIRKLRKALLVNTHCRKLWYIFAPHLPVIYTRYTCDLDIFYPENKKKNDKLVVGWAGSIKNNGDIRGVNDIIKPACDGLDNIELKLQCAEDFWEKDDNKMREYYNSLDLYLCASKSEGTPRPLIEAAACGVPSLTTDVGLVPEFVEDNKNGVIIDRGVRAFAEKLKFFAENRELLPEMGKAARRKMETDFNWKDIIHQWTDFFESALELFTLKKEGLIKR